MSVYITMVGVWFVWVYSYYVDIVVLGILIRITECYVGVVLS